MCTSLVYRDAAGRSYFGRTLELTVDLPYRVAWFPVGYNMSSHVADHPPVGFTTRYGVLAITMEVKGLDAPGGGAATEFTCWTSISDLDRKLFLLRDHETYNDTRFDLTALAGADKLLVSPFQRLRGDPADGAAALKSA
ncbi:hypothetical protein [Thiocapsa marina]|uniref:Choloylglycine hydrolase n=1 Tax=Thiocapsa marina 5811 TaxID=768671 RepID=F9UB99_9GAMM|nr:hypothetical protein [Thiocapsa marina]EGV18717.1 Choloylglycine hydrolase [Thiocapsa marina 5811]